MSYYEAPRQSAGAAQQDVWQDRGQDDDAEDEYMSPGVRALRERFVETGQYDNSRNLGSGRPPPPRPMTPPRDYDGTDVYEGESQPTPRPAGTQRSTSTTQLKYSAFTPHEQEKLHEELPYHRSSPQRIQSRPAPQRPPPQQRQPPRQPQVAPQPQYQPQVAPQPPQPQYQPYQPSSSYQSTVTLQPQQTQPDSWSHPSTAMGYHQSPSPPRGQPFYNTPPTKSLQQSAGNDDTDEPRVVHLQYNSPLQLYSTDNARDTLDAQTKGAPGYGTLMVKGVQQQFDPSQSYVLQAINDDRTRSAPRPVTQQKITLMQPSHNASDF